MGNEIIKAYRNDGLFSCLFVEYQKEVFFMDHKDVCGTESIWFILSDKKKEGRRFLQWAKQLGCVWLNGEEIEPRKGTDFFTLCITKDGKLGNVSAMALVSKQFQDVKRVRFADHYRSLKGTKGRSAL